MIKNITNQKYTTGAAIVILIYVIAKAFGLDLSERLAMPLDEIIVVVGGAVTAIILAFSRDPKDNNNDRKD